MHLVFIFNMAKLPDKNFDADGVMNELMKVIREPEYASREFIATVAMNSRNLRKVNKDAV